MHGFGLKSKVIVFLFVFIIIFTVSGCGNGSDLLRMSTLRPVQVRLHITQSAIYTQSARVAKASCVGLFFLVYLRQLLTNR